MKSKKWEYKIIQRNTSEILGGKQLEFINQQGEHGWELVHIEVQYIDRGIVPCLHTFTFKRSY
jgi:hypothetical protein